MSVTESSATRGHLRRILTVGLVMAALALLAVLGAMGYSASTVDRMAARRDQALVVRTLERRLVRMTEDVTSATIWDDAWKATMPRFDMEWVNVNFGEYYAEYMHHDRTVAYDPTDRLVYASQDGEQAELASAAAFSDQLKPLLTRLRAAERGKRGAAGKAPAAGFDGNVSAATTIRADGELWLVAASTVTPENAGLKMTDSPAPVVASARKLGPVFMKGLEDDLGLANAQLILGAETLTGPVVPLRDPAGRTLGRLTWTPAEPGMGVLLEVAPAVALALALVFLAGGVLALRINRALRALAVNDDALTQTLEALTAARDQAEMASIAKSQFLANISHEIRTPLNGVLGMAQIMERGELDAAQRGRLAVIRDSGATLLSLLNDVLDLAKIEAGKLEITRTDVDLVKTVTGACDTFRATAAEKGLQFGVLIEPEAQGVWRIDGMRLSQVLGNLISNAVKFTPQGHVTVRAWRSDRGLEFAVTDTGPGIPPERAADLFGKFNQLDASTTRQFGGTGLGLAICRELVELMDGQLTVESRVGSGSMFSFWLPASKSERRAAA